MNENTSSIKEVIHTFIRKSESDKNRPEPTSIDEIRAWILKAANNASFLKKATHVSKFDHPSTQTSSILLTQPKCNDKNLVGSHCLTHPVFDYAVGNASALPTVEFINIDYQGKTLIQLLKEKDKQALLVLSEDETEAARLASLFLAIVNNEDEPFIDYHVKQVYFPVKNGSYHILAPIFPTSLVHQAYLQIKEHRYSESAKTARTAHKEGAFSEQGYKEYPHITVQKFGGSQPHNISKLNTKSNRKGENWLLPSFPPTWQSQGVQPPNHIDSVFSKYLLRRRSIRELTKGLREFLAKKIDENNMEIRQQRAEFMARIVDEVFLFSFELLELPAGWSAASDCKLVKEEALWLDPYRRHLNLPDDEGFNKDYEQKYWPEEIAKRFANWLNTLLATDDTPMNQATAQQWQDDFETELSLFRLEL